MFPHSRDMFMIQGLTQEDDPRHSWKAPEQGPLPPAASSTRLGCGCRDIEQAWPPRLRPPAAAPTTQEEKKIIPASTVSVRDPQRTLPAQMSEGPVQPAGLTPRLRRSCQRTMAQKQHFSIKGTEQNHQGKFSKFHSAPEGLWTGQLWVSQKLHK